MYKGEHVYTEDDGDSIFVFNRKGAIFGTISKSKIRCYFTPWNDDNSYLPEELLEIAAAVCIFEKEENGKDSNIEKSDIKAKK
jgi:hypothetical protein